MDSYCILTNSLAKLAKNLELDLKKTHFPYTFSRHNTLFYVGNTPDISHYNKYDITKEEYDLLYTNNWSFKDISLEYLTNDLNILYGIIHLFNKELYNDYNINISDVVTVSGLAMKIFLSQHYSNNIPRINKPSIYRDIKEAYFGGITEVYRPHGYNLFYYDVNSLYPFVALSDMPGLNSDKITYFNINPDIMSLFGFFLCEVEAPRYSVDWFDVLVNVL